MTYREALERAGAYLEECRIADARTDAWYLMEYCCHMSRTQYLMKLREPVPEEEYARYQELLQQRGTHVPLQHITGEQEFMGLSFRVNDQVLIPRQDTEILVEQALQQAKAGMRVLDLCTGSGCIIISLLKLCPGLLGTASDISPEALQTAGENARRLGVETVFIESDLFERISGSFDLIVSNPPYIPTGVIDSLMAEVRLFEPRTALDGREDGLYFYRRIIAESGPYLKTGGWLMFEIGSDQGEAVSGLMRRGAFRCVRVVRDLSGLDRVVIGCRC
ncbi:MAG: peptide chain release factor N(5)-glutamine methyltransferase [Lachnospiraceae bacterium]|nr:peptide chain release factor N(5)-glutamine methyltransferase [Lachnospiraceae bacterium]